MMAREKQAIYVKGTAGHRRTESDYMGVLLDTVSLEDWREVVNGALQSAKDGDTQARAWLAHYLVGKPEGKAPTPLTVVVQQWSGGDPVADRLAKPIINRAQFPSLHQHDDFEASVKAAIASELAQKNPLRGNSGTPAPARDTADSLQQ